MVLLTKTCSYFRINKPTANIYIIFRTNWMENWFKKNHHSSDWCRAALCFGWNSRRTHRKIWYERMQTRKNEPWCGTKRTSLWWRTGLWLSFLWTGMRRGHTVGKDIHCGAWKQKEMSVVPESFYHFLNQLNLKLVIWLLKWIFKCNVLASWTSKDQKNFLLSSLCLYPKSWHQINLSLIQITFCSQLTMKM